MKKRVAKALDSESLAEALVQQVLLRQDGWAYNFNRESDFGIDITVDLLKTGESDELLLSGKTINMQLKSGDSYKRTSDDENYLMACFDNDNNKVRAWIYKWLKQSSLTLIVWLPNPNENPHEAYWISVHDLIRKNPSFYNNPSRFKFLKTNKFTREQMERIKVITLNDIRCKKIREIPRKSFQSLDIYLRIYDKDEFIIDSMTNILAIDKLEEDFEIVDWRWIHWGFIQEVPKTFFSGQYINRFDKEHNIVETKWLLKHLIDEIPNKEKVKPDEISSVIEEWENNLSLRFRKGLITPSAWVQTRNIKITKGNFDDESLIRHDGDEKIALHHLKGLQGEFGSYIILTPKEPIAIRENVVGPEAVIRTFNPAEYGYLTLLGINPEENFEIEFNHIVQYKLIGNSLKNTLLIELIDVDE